MNIQNSIKKLPLTSTSPKSETTVILGESRIRILSIQDQHQTIEVFIPKKWFLTLGNMIGG